MQVSPPSTRNQQWRIQAQFFRKRREKHHKRSIEYKPHSKTKPPEKKQPTRLSPMVKKTKNKKRRGTRGKGRGWKDPSVFNKIDKFVIYQNNIRSLTSKQCSIKNIISRISPGLITLQETNMKGNNELSE